MANRSPTDTTIVLTAQELADINDHNLQRLWALVGDEKRHRTEHNRHGKDKPAEPVLSPAQKADQVREKLVGKALDCRVDMLWGRAYRNGRTEAEKVFYECRKAGWIAVPEPIPGPGSATASHAPQNGIPKMDETVEMVEHEQIAQADEYPKDQNKVDSENNAGSIGRKKAVSLTSALDALWGYQGSSDTEETNDFGPGEHSAGSDVQLFSHLGTPLTQTFRDEVHKLGAFERSGSSDQSTPDDLFHDEVVNPNTLGAIASDVDSDEEVANGLKRTISLSSDEDEEKKRPRATASPERDGGSGILGGLTEFWKSNASALGNILSQVNASSEPSTSGDIPAAIEIDEILNEHAQDQSNNAMLDPALLLEPEGETLARALLRVHMSLFQHTGERVGSCLIELGGQINVAGAGGEHSVPVGVQVLAKAVLDAFDRVALTSEYRQMLSQATASAYYALENPDDTKVRALVGTPPLLVRCGLGCVPYGCGGPKDSLLEPMQDAAEELGLQQWQHPIGGHMITFFLEPQTAGDHAFISRVVRIAVVLGVPHFHIPLSGLRHESPDIQEIPNPGPNAASGRSRNALPTGSNASAKHTAAILAVDRVFGSILDNYPGLKTSRAAVVNSHRSVTIPEVSGGSNSSEQGKLTLLQHFQFGSLVFIIMETIKPVARPGKYPRKAFGLALGRQPETLAAMYDIGERIRTAIHRGLYQTPEEMHSALAGYMWTRINANRATQVTTERAKANSKVAVNKVKDLILERVLFKTDDVEAKAEHDAVIATLVATYNPAT
ncbi:hypothetical protein HMN09_00215200 [Mycena chlorophos]|uniref:Uncharacterized protein n=1 Tax=Mycena chlorophos TaxID=658473 RepID=A0A8H6TKI3_MYCCL|nr:hypothetical protein HMN09_00215200 [Mycena chlorophos]